MSKHMKMKNTIRLTKNFFKRLKRITFSNPQKNDVLLFDQRSSKIIKGILLHDINCTVLPIRNELNYVSIQLIAITTKNLIKIAFQYKGKKLFNHKELPKITWHLLSCIEYISPKVVLTCIDNSGSFQWISRHYDKATFYVIQNGFHGNLGTAERGDLAHSMPHFMCFGRFEEDSYKKYNCKVDNFYPVGSLLGGYYKYEICNGLRVETDYDICLVSQFREQMITEGKSQKIKKELTILNTFFKKYIDEHDSVMANIACASNMDIEEQYFETVFGDRVHIIKNIRDEFTTYRSMDRSDVILTAGSTAGIEALGWGKKVLFCNFSNQDAFPIFQFPDVCTVTIPDYNVFCAKLDYLRGLDDLTYRKLTEDSARYFMNYDPQNPPHKFIREKIFKCLP